jgi:Ca2+-binding EF-hand superfamily protein
MILLNLASKISEETMAKERLTFQLINKSNSGSITSGELINYWRGHDSALVQ